MLSFQWGLTNVMPCMLILTSFFYHACTGSKCCSSFPWLRQKREPIIPILSHLQWLLVKFKIEYKVFTFCIFVLAGLAPTCIADQKTNQGTRNYSVAAHKPSSGCHMQIITLQILRPKYTSLFTRTRGQRTVCVTRIASSEQYVHTVRAPTRFL